jgi:hypothetical protein
LEPWKIIKPADAMITVVSREATAIFKTPVTLAASGTWNMARSSL